MATICHHPGRLLVGLLLTLCTQSALADAAGSLSLRFNCSHTEGKGDEQVIYADVGEVAIKDNVLTTFAWESSLHRRTHGFDCSIDQEDGLLLEPISNGWRVRLQDGAKAREKRGFDTERGQQCSIRVLQDGDVVQLVPTCALLCGSRSNFSALRIHTKSKNCEYE